jgi:hypothetical protein
MFKRLSTLFTIAALCILTHTNVHAQYTKGSNLLNVGIGLGALGYGGLPIGASFEHGFTDKISAGGFFDYLQYNSGYLTYKYSWRIMYFGARGSYHLNEILKLDNEKIDVYAGLGIGYQTFGTSDNLASGYSGYSNRVFLNAHAGARYYFSNSMAAFGELGYGVAALKLGLTFKFGGDSGK